MNRETEDNERRCVELFRVLRGASKAEQERIESTFVLMYRDLIHGESKKFLKIYRHQTSDIEDLIQAASIGVIKAVRTFDYQKSSVFFHHAYSRVRAELQAATLADRTVRKSGSRNKKNYNRADIVYTDHITAAPFEVGDMRDDIEDMAIASEIALHDLSDTTKMNKRKIQRRLRLKCLIR